MLSGKIENRHASITIDIDTLAADLSIKKLDEESEKRIRQISYLEIVPSILDILSGMNIKATFFIVGKDGIEKENRKIIRRIYSHGHEIANHGFSHNRGMVRLSKKEFIDDVLKSGDILSDIIGRKISGFRMPGATINKDSLICLKELGYIYDSSLNSSLLYNMSKFCYFKLFKRNQRFPCQHLSSLFAINEPYFPDSKNIYKSSKDNLGILEFPITLLPYLSLPFMNYFLIRLGRGVSRQLYKLIREKKIFLNFIMHDHEFAEKRSFRDFGPIFGFFKNIIKQDISNRKIMIGSLLRKIKDDYSIVTLESYAASMRGYN